MRLTTGTGVTLIAVGAVLAFAVDPPRWIVEYVDVIDLGLVLLWIGILVIAIHVYLYAPRKPKAPRRDRGADRHRPHTDRYAPGQFASPRHEQYDQGQYDPGQYGQYPPPAAPQAPPAPYPGGYPAAGQDETRVYPQQGAAPTPPVPADDGEPTQPRRRPAPDQGTQYLPRRDR
jgi:hypothetical protein